jgi:glycosyltransferase involved in cell wall biosynthesis
MKIILLFNLFPEDQKEAILSNIKTEVQNATLAFETTLLNGLINNIDNVELVNVPILGYYPTQYKKMFLKHSPFYYKGKNMGVNVGICNLFIYKQWSLYINLRKELKKILKANPNEEIVFLHLNYNSSFLKALTYIKKRFSNVKIISIVGDLPQNREIFGKFIFLKKILHKINMQTIYKCLKYIDGYILVSKYMRDKLFYANNNNSIILECAYDTSNENKNDYIKQDLDNKKFKDILYSGKITERFGLMKLVEAFKMLQNNNYRLIICGSGPAESAIKEIAKMDNRIIFKGNIDRKEVIFLQRKADLLVNPRTPEGEYTRYSFPSKTMEYLASGTPTLLYKLSGIPEEYYNYCFSLNEDDGVDILANTINNILCKDKSNLDEIAYKARQFILNEKSHDVQGKRIVEFITYINKLPV